MKIIAIALAIAAAFMAPVLAFGQEITSEVIEENDGTRTLIHESVIDAPVADVWAALSTEEGWKMWGPSTAWFDLRLGGSIETSYYPDTIKGDPRNIVQRIIAFVPERMMALQVLQAPEGGPVSLETIKQTWGVYELDPISETQTRMRIIGLGYGGDEGSSRMLEFFKSGNVYSINLLKKNLADARAQASQE
ncbi:SRPBCC family protein [Altererythrobacter lutimaris]|uniref:SRPBCC family protein n=1 Tax=Altererythrobacter lutimaris TaxID=2743979 RepID=A0A850HF15_9SPHN|nr:SRPBCC family protein [Altererythrobacter lutimaris]NVE95746.1 SRPBCC family protein [Altererythrobacter lutimaris]